MKRSKSFTSSIVPAAIFALRDSFRLRDGYGFTGNYTAWQDALDHSTGYDAPEILERVKTSMLKVMSGESKYERDSCLFDEIQYSWPILAALLRTAARCDSILNLLDFGGSLGTSYYQNKGFLSGLKKIRWCVVEQPTYVEAGKTYFQNDELVFYSDIQTCKGNENVDVVLMSGVLQYLEKPHDLLQKILDLGIEDVIVDRTPFLPDSNHDLLTIQTVPPDIYPASYPHWFFSREKFLKNFSNNGYVMLAEFAGFDEANIKNSQYSGFIFSKQDVNGTR